MAVYVSAEQVADEVLALGETTPERVELAASLVAEFVRRLNHATFSPAALPWSSSVGHVANQCRAALGGMKQLLEQLAWRLEDFTADPRLYHDDYHDRALAAGAAEQAAQCLRATSAGLSLACSAVDQAANAVGHLGINAAD